MEPVTVPLSTPIEIDETITAPDGSRQSVKRKLATLTFREAEVGDLVAADSVAGDTGKTAAMLAGMCGVPLPAIKKLKMRDLNRILKDVGPLLGNEVPQTGDGSTSA